MFTGAQHNRQETHQDEASRANVDCGFGGVCEPGTTYHDALHTYTLESGQLAKLQTERDAAAADGEALARRWPKLRDELNSVRLELIYGPDELAGKSTERERQIQEQDRQHLDWERTHKRRLSDLDRLIQIQVERCERARREKESAESRN